MILLHIPPIALKHFKYQVIFVRDRCIKTFFYLKMFIMYGNAIFTKEFIP